MTASRPTGSLGQKAGVIDISDKDVPRHLLLLEMAFQAKRLVSFVQHSLINRAVRRMTDHTALTHCLVLVNKWAALGGVALEASFVSAQERKAPGFEHLLNIGPATLDCDPDVRVMAIRAAHLPLEHRVMMRQLELCTHFEVTLETSFRRLPRINDRVRRAATLDVQTARPVTRFAADVLCVFSFRHQPRVRGCAEIAHYIFVARFAFLGTDELRARDARRC
jgi:hypothetical protein